MKDPKIRILNIHVVTLTKIVRPFRPNENFTNWVLGEFCIEGINRRKALDPKSSQKTENY